MFLCCVINFEQLLHIDVMLSSNIRSGEGGGLGGKNEMLSDVRGQGIVSVVDVQSLFFSLKKIGFGPWPHLMLSQTFIYHWQEIFLLALMSDSEVIV